MIHQRIDVWRVRELLRYLRQHGVIGEAIATPTGGEFHSSENSLRLAHRKEKRKS